MKRTFWFAIILIYVFSNLSASGKLEDKLVQFAEDNSKKYIKPLVTAFGTNLNSGFYQTAKVLAPFRFGVSMSGMLAFVPQDEKTFMALSPSVTYEGNEVYIYDPYEIKSATIFGNKGGTFEEFNPDLINDPDFDFGNIETTLKLPNGGGLDYVPLLTPQINVGLPYGNEIMIRAFPSYEVNEDTGEISFWGVGLKHSIDQYLPGVVPIDLAIQGVYQYIKITDVMTFNSYAFNAQISKKLMMFTFYGGLQYENCTMKADYKTEFYNYDISAYDDLRIKYTITGDNNFRATIGARYSFLVFRMFVDYTLAKYQVLHMGLGLSF